MAHEALDEREEGTFSLRELAELVGRRMGVELGRQRLELLFEDGRLVEVFKHDRVGSRELEELLVDLSPAARRMD